MHNHNAQDVSKHFALSCAGVDLDLGPRRIDLQNLTVQLAADGIGGLPRHSALILVTSSAGGGIGNDPGSPPCPGKRYSSAQLPCAHCGSRRHTFTTAARRRSPMPLRTTTGFVLSALPRISNATWSSI
jgi:hypothetical protein